MFPFDAGLIALIVAVLVLFLTVLIKLEAPTEFGPGKYPEKKLHKKEPEKPKTPPLKHPKTRPSECSHFFGYLKKIPKNSTIPDDCFVCPKMVECLLKSVDSQIEHKD